MSYYCFMAPGNRKTPTGAASSESDFSVMEFARHVPRRRDLPALALEHPLQPGRRRRPTASGARRSACSSATRASSSARRGRARPVGYQVYPTAGTIFHKSSTALHLWFHAMYLMTSTRCGISAKQLERELGVTYKTAWRMFTLIRNELMTQDDDDASLGRGRDGRDVRGRQATPRTEAVRQTARPSGASAAAQQVVGHERRCRCSAWSSATGSNGRRRPTVVTQPRQGDSACHPEQTGADPHGSRRAHGSTRLGLHRLGLPGHGRAAEHQDVNHPAKVYVSGNVHTQTIDGFWSLVKRGISGTHHAVSPKWLQGYLNEYVWRYNHRDDRGRCLPYFSFGRRNPTG